MDEVHQIDPRLKLLKKQKKMKEEKKKMNKKKKPRNALEQKRRNCKTTRNKTKGQARNEESEAAEIEISSCFLHIFMHVKYPGCLSPLWKGRAQGKKERVCV